MVFVEALEHDRKEEPIKKVTTMIGEVIRDTGKWREVSSHRFPEYGIQRAWKRIDVRDRERFIPMESADCPFE